MRTWRRFKLAELADINPSLQVTPAASDAVTFVPMAAVSASSASIEAFEEKPYADVKKGYTPFQNGDLLVAKITPCFENGKIAQVSMPHPVGFGSTEFHVVRPRTDRLNPRFLLRYLRQETVRQEGERRMTGSAGQRRVPEVFLSSLAIPTPPLPQQNRIAAVLDATEHIRSQRRGAIAQLGELAQSIFLRTFTGEPTRGWLRTTVADVASSHAGSIRTGPFGSQLLHSEFVSEGVAALGIDNAVLNEFTWGERRFISADKYQALKRFAVRPGDVLIIIMGTCGRCAIVPQDIPLAISTKHLCCITLDQRRCLPSFLHAYFLLHPLARDFLRSQTKGAIMAGLNMGIIKALPLSLPPIDLQHAFAARIAAIDKLKAAHRASLAELDALFASLQHRAFSGAL